jgi:hypothetical protein
MPNQTFANNTGPIAAKTSGSKDYGGSLSYVSSPRRYGIEDGLLMRVCSSLDNVVPPARAPERITLDPTTASAEEEPRVRPQLLVVDPY